MKIRIEEMSPDGLSMCLYDFTAEYGNLVYSAFGVVRRSNIKEEWYHKIPKVLSYDEWCESNNKTPVICYYDIEEWEDLDQKATNVDSSYAEYVRNNTFPTTTKDDKPKFTLISASIEHLPHCPSRIADRALAEYVKQVKVIYRTTDKRTGNKC